MNSIPRKSQVSALLGITADDARLRCLAEAAYYLQNLGRIEDAATMYAAIHCLAPNDPLGPLGLAELSLAKGDYSAAVRAARAASRAWHVDRPTLALAYKRLAEGLYGLGRTAEAVRSLTTAAELDPDGIGSTIATWIVRRRRNQL